jgi:hypothetical protein
VCTCLAIGLEEFNGITVVHVVLSHFVRFGVVPALDVSNEQKLE